jgi:microcystin-dependent protein
VHLLENFSSPSAPSNGIEGQVWYNNSTKRLYVNDSTGGSSNWRPASGTHVQPTSSQPSNPLLGDLWVDTITQQLNLYNGTDWVLVGPSALAGKKTGVYVEQISGSDGITHFASVEYANDIPIKIIATESFFPERTIEGFTQLNPGINLSSKLFIGPADSTVASTKAKIYGASTSSDGLNVTSPSIATVSADNFSRRDVANIMYGQQTILNDAGINIGTASNFSLSVVQGTTVIKNSSDGGSMDFIVANQGAQNIIIKVDGKNKRVGINHPTPNVELDVNGDAYVSGTLTALGTVNSTSPTTGALLIRGGVGIGKNLSVANNIVSNGHIRVGEIDSSGNTVSGPAIVPNAHLLYDIGTATNRFKTVYAENFNGSFSGSFQGTVTGSVIGAASSLANSTNFQIAGDVVTISASSFSGSGGTLTLTTSLSDKAITEKTEVIDNRVDDQLLVYRANTGLRRVTRTNFLLGEAFIPIGTILPYAAPNPPLGYLLCDGALVARTEYPYLFQVIGSIYGSAGGGAYFRLPDLRGRFPLGNVAMANGLSNLVIAKTLTQSTLNSNILYVSNTDTLYAGMVVTGDSGIPVGTVITNISTSNSQVTINNTVTVPITATITFTLRVLRDSIENSVTDRVSNVPGNNAPSVIGSNGGSSKVTENLINTGTTPLSVPAGTNSTFNTNFDVNLTNPYLTINYIIRTGVGTTQLQG